MSKRFIALSGMALVLHIAACGDSSVEAAPPAKTALSATPTTVIPGMKMRKGVDESCLPRAEPSASGSTTPAAGYTSVDAVADAGTINGTITYTGNQTDELLAITSDHAVCEDPATPGKRKAGAVLVADGKVQNAVVYLDGIKTGRAFSPESKTIDNRSCMFSPRVSIMHKGDEFAARNSDPVLHNTHMFLKKGSKTRELENIALNKKGAVVKKKIKKTGLVDIKCDAHVWMQGWIFVTDHPYTVLTDANGNYTLTDVPPGDYTLKVWHEKLQGKATQVTVGPGGTVTSDLALE